MRAFVREARRRGAILLIGSSAVLAFACRKSPAQKPPPSAISSAVAAANSAALEAPFARPDKIVVVEWIFDGGRKADWQDWGWAPHDDVPSGPARVNFSNWGGWQLAKMGLGGTYGGVTFRYKAPAGFGDFLTLHVENANKKDFPVAKITDKYRKTVDGGWFEVFVPIQHLNPDDLDFDRVVFFVSKAVPKDLVSIDKVGLTAPPDPKTLPPPPVHDVAFTVDVGAKGVRIDPLIYAIAFDPMHDGKDQQQWQLGATARRWGGNPSSRYNWEIGHAWNTAQDWFWENVNYTDNPNYSYALFLRDNAAHGMKTALTVPMLGWVAKDTTSYSFPTSAFGPQESTDQWKPEAGNGKGKDGKPIPPGPPTRTSIAATPEFIRRWIETIRREDQRTGARSVHEYILDNEPNLWSSTHRDVHPEPVSYDELLEKTIAYGSAIRAADPDAVIAGPAEWGWTNFLYSAKDTVRGVTLRPDRRAHGDVPLVAWYLQKLKEHEQKTGTRILDVLDLHFYPQADHVYSPDAGKSLAAVRLRSTRALWDPAYTDESWINEAVRLIPRMKEWVAQNYPGRGISIGEWNFGGEGHMSGGLAVAEALGRFGQNELTSAYYWTYPPANSPAFWAFRAYRNFDGKGGRFEDVSLPVSAVGGAEGASLFASKDASGKHVVLVALNLTPNAILRAKIALNGVGEIAKEEAYTYAGGPAGFGPAKAVAPGAAIDLPAYSMTVVDVRVK